MQRVLVVDDEPIVRDVVRRYLERDGYEAVHAPDGESALAAIATGNVSLVVLDVMLPGMSGLDVCRRVRTRSDVPIILLTARSGEADRIVGLEIGADDYVTKPFSPRELAARVKTVLRRGATTRPAEQVTAGDLVIDAGTREVVRDGAPLRLTAREFDLLLFLARHPRQVFSREHLIDRVWGDHPANDTATVTVHVRRLREKVEHDPSRPERIQTVWGVGYRFAP